MPNSRHSAAIFSPSSSRATNFSRSSMGSHTFQGILRPPQKAPLCYPCLQNELSPFFQEGHNVITAWVISQKAPLATMGTPGGRSLLHTFVVLGPSVVAMSLASCGDAGVTPTSAVQQAAVVCNEWGRCWRTGPRYYRYG